MKQIREDKEIARQEESIEAVKQMEKESMDKALESFRKSAAYPYVMKFFKEYEDQLVSEIEAIQNSEMKKIFMLPKTKQVEKIAEMAKRDMILTGVLGTLKRIKGKL